ncbi:hypothetical protein [Pseudomonas fluorescens]|uniref:hypothetical protein n=1 Tax=Pseudomonas fluorescens TaxID=294 RepID=UPI003D070B3E
MSNNFLSCGFRSVFFLALPFMGACSWAGQIAKDGVEGATSYYSSDHFTLVATVPANFGFTSKAQYSPRAGKECKTYVSALGGEVTRHQQKTDEISAKPTQQTARFNIPLEYHIAGCTMDLTHVGTDIEGRYGPSSLDLGGDGGGITIRDTEPTNTSTSGVKNDEEFLGLCTWMFQLSVARIQKDGISKILSCSAADNNWNVPSDYFSRSKPGGSIIRPRLKNKEIKMTLRISDEEEPSMDNRWIKTPKGWKPCQGTEKSNRCQTPPTFKNFKINGRECTVYPNCTE